MDRVNINLNIKEIFDHMLETFSRYSLFDLEIKADGDLTHHLVEDIESLGCFSEAIGNKRINRIGFCYSSMDDSLVMTSLDIGGRHYTKFDLSLSLIK